MHLVDDLSDYLIDKFFYTALCQSFRLMTNLSNIFIDVIDELVLLELTQLLALPHFVDQLVFLSRAEQ